MGIAAPFEMKDRKFASCLHLYKRPVEMERIYAKTKFIENEQQKKFDGDYNDA